MKTRLETLRERYEDWTTLVASRSGRGTEVFVSPDGTRVARIGWDRSHAQFVQIAQANASCTGLPKILAQCVHDEEKFVNPWVSVTEIERLYEIDPQITQPLNDWMIESAVAVSQGKTPTTDPYGLAEALKIVSTSLKTLPPGESYSLDAQAKNVMLRRTDHGEQFVWMDALD